VTLDNAVLDIRGIRGTLVTPSGSVAIDSSAIGAHNLENILSAAAAALAAGVSLDAIARGVRSFTVPGRLERVDNDRGFHVFVDYAHTPDGLLNVLRTLKPLTAGRLITVFGCGGDRDRTKRPKMGAIAETWSDVCIVTSDNPRTEHPNAIIDQIREGMTQNGHLIEPDRRRAIGLAIATARPGDAILIAGKGHETYQILNTGTIDFDDRIEAGKALDAHAH
jgi:UDP-N-acetylmuramyl-tripeptide synthetase